jgi:hypothetical protein
MVLADAFAPTVLAPAHLRDLAFDEQLRGERYGGHPTLAGRYGLNRVDDSGRVIDLGYAASVTADGSPIERLTVLAAVRTRINVAHRRGGDAGVDGRIRAANPAGWLDSRGRYDMFLFGLLGHLRDLTWF